MPQLQEIWNKFNPRERLTAIGAGLVVLAWLIGLVARGFGVASLGLVGAIAIIVVLYLKYAPNMNITWPIPVPLITLGISALVALFALLNLIDYLGVLEFLGATGIIAFALYVVGAVVMLLGSWQEYQIVKPAMPNFSGTGTGSSAPPASPPAGAPPPAATPAPTVPPTTPSDTDDLPPA